MPRRRRGFRGRGRAMNERPANTFERKTFTTSRLAEFATEFELTKQVGQPAPSYGRSSSSRNSSTTRSTPPRRPESRRTSRSRSIPTSIVVADNGPGIPAATVRKLANFDAKTSSNAAYVAPTRGQQGNALQSHPADGLRPRRQGGLSRHRSQRPRPSYRLHHRSHPPDARGRDPVRSLGGKNRHSRHRALAEFTKVAASTTSRTNSYGSPIYYVWLNPHLALTATWFGEEVVAWAASDPAWSKWKPDFATSPHWYSPERLRLLIASEIAHAEDSRKPSPSRARVRAAVPRPLLDREGLDDLLRHLERRRARDAGGLLSSRARRRPRLLSAMRGLSAPVKPAQLGVIGKDHLEERLVASGCEPDSLVYRKAEIEHDGLPYVIEVAFGYRNDGGVQCRRGLQLHPGDRRLAVPASTRGWLRANRDWRSGHRIRACRLPALRLPRPRQVAGQPAGRRLGQTQRHGGRGHRQMDQAEEGGDPRAPTPICGARDAMVRRDKPTASSTPPMR